MRGCSRIGPRSPLARGYNASSTPRYTAATSGLGYVDFDAALAKTFQIHEAVGFQFRADAYNTFNHVNWSNPNGNFTTLATFGNITSANSMRVFELMGKLTF